MDAQEEADRAAARAQESLARVIRDVRDDARATRTNGLLLPTLDEDPPADDPTGMWRFEDGRLRIRRADGGVDEFVPNVDWTPKLPTFSSVPAVGTGWRIWTRGDGRLQYRLADDTVVTLDPAAGGASGDGGQGAQGAGSSSTPKPAQQTTRRFTDTYGATWSATYCPAHGLESKAPLYYGTFPGSSHPERRVMLGLNDSAIRNDLDGARIRGVWIRMRNDHAWYNGGVTVHFGGHNSSGQPSGYGSVRERVWKGQWPKNGYGAGWRRVPDWFGEKLRDNKIKGITINQPSSSQQFYGAMAPGTFQIRISYSKAV